MQTRSDHLVTLAGGGKKGNSSLEVILWLIRKTSNASLNSVEILFKKAFTFYD